MALDARIETLEQRHQQLDNVLSDKLKHLASSDSEIADIKRQKLQIKDTLEQLKADEALH